MDELIKSKIYPLLKAEHKNSFIEERGQFVIREFTNSEISSNSLNRFKDTVKRRFNRFYPLMIKILSPVYGKDLAVDFLNHPCKEDFIALNLGSGTHNYKNVINIDGNGYQNVHIVCNLEDLPIEDNCVDRIVSIAVLEHVPFPQKHVSEFLRVLKPGGKLLAYIPFLQPFHASPYDFQRYTSEGMKILFRDFNCEEVKVGAGPTSALVWTLQEWLAILFSFGSLKLYRIIQPLFWILSPLKYIDCLLNLHPASKNAASGFYILASKKVL